MKMIGELTVWLMVYASDPNTNKLYEIEDTKISIVSCETSEAECVADKCAELQRPRIIKAVGVKRGDWMLSVKCQLEHEEATPALLEKPEEP
jgi:hypothetical protein